MQDMKMQDMSSFHKINEMHCSIICVYSLHYCGR